MKKNVRQLAAFLSGILLMFFMQNGCAQRILIAGWTFPSAPTTNVVSAGCGVGTIYADGTNGSSLWTVQSSSSAGLYFKNAGTASASSLCDDAIAGMSMSVIGQAYNDSSIVFVVSTANMTDVQISYNERASSASASFSTHTWAHSTDGVNFTTDTVCDGMRSATSSSTFASHIVTVSFPADVDEQEVVYLRVTFTGCTSAGANNRIDNIEISGASDAPFTAQPSFSQNAGNYCADLTVDITCATEGATIYYTLDGTEPTSENGTLYESPLLINASTTLQAIAYLDGVASAVKSADFVLPTSVASISAFKEVADGEFVRISSDLTTIYANGSYLFVQDETGATCIYGASMPSFSPGDVITDGVCGVMSPYNGMKELASPEFINSQAVPGTAIEPIAVSMSELVSNWSNYECKLVSLSGLTFEEGTFINSSNSVFAIYHGTDTLNCANQFRTLTGVSTPTSVCQVTGIAVTNSQRNRIAPRTVADILAMETAITIGAPYYGQIFEEGDSVIVSLQTAFFDFENNSYIQADLLQNDAPVHTFTLTTASQLEAFLQTDLSTYMTTTGDFLLAAAIKDDENVVLASDTVMFSRIETYVAIETSASSLYFESAGESHSFTVSAFHLDAPITCSIDNESFTVSPTQLPADAMEQEVTVVFNGEESASATLTLSSGNTTAVVTLQGVIPIDEVIYTTGFEVAEQFTSSTSYNNDSPVYNGPSDQQWSIIHGTVSANTSDRIFGEQSLQMRYYGSTASSNQHLGHIGYATTDFELHNVTKVAFFAKSTGSLNLTGSYSFDGGATFEGDTTFQIGVTAQKYVLNVSEMGEHYGNRIRFAMVLPEEVGTGTYKLIIDSVVVYGVTGLEPSVVETPTISQPTNNYLTPITVTLACATEGATIYYTTDGSTPTQNSTLYEAPFTIGSTCELKVRAFKGGLDPSNVAFAQYNFPVEVANIAAFKSAGAADNSITYKITGDVTFVFRSGRRIFVEDATGGLLVYDNATPVVTLSYTEGDVVSGGIIGTYTLYNGMAEMVPMADWGAASGTVTVTPIVATAADVRDQYATLESRLVRLNEMEFAQDVTFTTEDYSESEISDNTGTLLLRNQFKTLDTTISQGAHNDVIGFVAHYSNSTSDIYQIYPRSNADIIEVEEDTTMIHESEALRLRVYPNPARESVVVDAACNGGTLELLNAYGQVVYRCDQPVYPVVIDLSERAAGLYFVRMTSTGRNSAVVKVTKM